MRPSNCFAQRSFSSAQDVGVISREDAIDFGLSGPNLRGSGVEHDVRRATPYMIYDRFDFDVPIGTKGDCYDRYAIRILEMRERENPAAMH